MKNILIVDDDIAIVESLKFAFKDKYNLFLHYDLKSAFDCYLKEDISVTILDLKLGNDNGMDLYNKIKDLNPEAVVIIITGYGTIQSSVEAIKSGVFYYLTKPIDLSELEILIEKGVEVDNLYRKINELDKKSKSKYEDFGIIAESESMKGVLNTIEKIKHIDSSVLITGESGTGKSLIANFIHSEGNRKDGSMNILNCAAIPKELLESELFGYKKGAFTGATNDKKGYFELSNGGTLFLDEIGDMDLALQGKLLYAIQEKRIRPLGSETEIELDVRLITATNKDLPKLIDEGKFREDLFYRLNVINLHVPPLRERKKDIVHLVNHFVNKYSKVLNKDVEKIEYEYIKELQKHDFKGNIRELENLVERSIALSDSKILSEKDILQYIDVDPEGKKTLVNKLIPIFVGDNLEEIERKVIETTYRECDYNQRKTADLLGITDRTIRNKLKTYRDKDN